MKSGAEVRISTKQNGQYWKGAIRNCQGEIIWECLHCHRNRDQSTKSSGTSARDCAKQAIDQPKLYAAGLGMR